MNLTSFMTGTVSIYLCDMRINFYLIFTYKEIIFYFL